MAGVKRVDQAFTSPRTRITSSCFLGLATNGGLGILGWFDSDKNTLPPTTAGIFSPGCLMINEAGSSTTTNLFANSGTTASPTWTVVTIS